MQEYCALELFVSIFHWFQAGITTIIIIMTMLALIDHLAIQFKFSVTWSCVSLPRYTTSSERKFMLFVKLKSRYIGVSWLKAYLTVNSFLSGVILAPVIDHVQNRGTFLWTLKVLWSNQVKNIFLESATFQFHARMLSSEVAQSLKSYGHFLDLAVAIGLSHRHVGFFG